MGLNFPCVLYSWLILALSAYRREYPLHDGDGRGWAARNSHIHGNDVTDLAATGVAFAEDATGAAAVANGNDKFRIGGRIEGSFDGNFHVSGYRSGHQQHVSMAWAGGEFDT